MSLKSFNTTAPETVLKIHCSGTPREIGLQHGLAARAQILRGLAFYKAYFKETANLDWDAAKAVALKFMPLLEGDGEWRDMVEEIKGVAEGAGSSVEFEDILAMNVRTEISMGLMTDGCTSLSWTAPSYHSPPKTFLAQNWDWDPRQQNSIISLTISTPSKPTISMMTEAGLIGKIGLNSSGLGVCLNAIRARGVDFSRLPVHLALRFLLNSKSKDVAIAQLEKVGVASACHILVADKDGGVGLEWSSRDLKKLLPEEGVVVHSNHFLVPHEGGIKEGVDLRDSKQRVVRIAELVAKAKADGEEPGRKAIEHILEDQKGAPAAINRDLGEGSNIRTLFGVVMDLREGEGKGWIRVGRPTDGSERLELKI